MESNRPLHLRNSKPLLIAWFAGIVVLPLIGIISICIIYDELDTFKYFLYYYSLVRYWFTTPDVETVLIMSAMKLFDLGVLIALPLILYSKRRWNGRFFFLFMIFQLAYTGFIIYLSIMILVGLSG
jgi:hypothetical protein